MKHSDLTNACDVKKLLRIALRFFFTSVSTSKLSYVIFCRRHTRGRTNLHVWIGNVRYDMTLESGNSM